MKSLKFVEATYSSKSLLSEIRILQVNENVGLEQFKNMIQMLYTHKLVFEFDPKFKVERIYFEKTDRATWNEYTVTDGREIGYITEVK